MEVKPGFGGETNWPNTPAGELAKVAMFGGEITLTEDIVLEEPLVVKGNTTINLNGKTITAAFEKGNGALVENTAVLTLVGGTLKNTYDNGDAVINNSGELVLDGVKIEGAPLADGGYSAYAVISSGKMTINNGTEVSADRGCLKLSGEGETIINGGTFINNDIGTRNLTSHVVDVENGGSNKFTINGGTFKHRHTATSGGVVICNRTTGTVFVNGGNFSGGNYYGYNNLSDYGYGGTFSVKGGTYTAQPIAKYIADGYKAVQSGDLFMVVEENVGGVATDNATLDTAIQNAQNDATIALSAGSYVIPDSAKGKTITFVGTGNPEDTTVVAENDGAAEGNCDYSLDGANVTFENITITTTGTYFPGYARCKGTYKNCIINGVFTLYDSSSFEKCTFNISGDLYNVWTWGAETATFTDCTFNCDGKAVLLYGGADTQLTMNNCVFNDNGTISGKAAIETGNGYGSSYTLVVNNATVNGFDINPNGTNTGTPLWANKNSMNANELKVNVDGIWYANGLVEDENGNLTVSDSAAVSTAIEVAEAGSTIVLDDTVADCGTITVGELKDVTIEGGANTVMTFVTNANTKIENVTLKNVGFAYDGSAGHDTGIVIDASAQVDNLVIEGCTFTGNGEKKGHSISGKNDNATIEIKGCTFKDVGYPIYAWGGYKALIIDNCTFDNIKSWAIMPQSGFDGDMTVTGCTFKNCLGGGLIKGGTLTAGHTFTFTDNTITGCTVSGDHNWFQFNVSAGTSVISGNTKDGQPWTPTAADGLK